jgi:hypothetical protein
MSLELGTIFLECIIVFITLLAVFKGRKHMLGFFISFGIYTYLNLAQYNNWHFKLLSTVSEPLLIFIATVAATYSIWSVYKN